MSAQNSSIENSVIQVMRRNIGTIVAFLGFTMLCVLTFGDIGEIASEAYWQNVKNNLMAIGFMSVSLTMIQVVIKQGIGEQALQKGMNSTETTEAIDKHSKAIAACIDRMVYLPYFLKAYNKRQTIIKRQEFLVDNNFANERALITAGSRRLIHKYNQTCVRITPRRMKWTTTDVVYDKHGQIETLQEYRVKRTVHAVISSAIFMVAMTLFTKGLFFTPSEEPIWQKFVKLFCYIIAIGTGSITQVIKEYEKGRFSVPNELADINEIWYEFKAWNIPDWVSQEVESYNNKDEEVTDGKVKRQRKANSNNRADIQEEQEESKDISKIGACDVLPAPGSSTDILLSDGSELGGQHSRNTESA